MFETLRRRVNYFLGDRREGRNEVKRTIDELGEFGEVAIVGGMLRDMLLKDYCSFASDVDLVIDTDDIRSLESYLAARKARRNRFGGYAVDGEWKVDVWILSRTWAHVEGHREVRRLNDVPATTFFNWDAILYSTRSRKIICSDNYLDHLRERYLDLNLRPNPNPIGNLVRTIRAAHRYHATLSPALASFACEQLEKLDHGAVLESERRSYGKRGATLDPAKLEHAQSILRCAATSGNSAQPFPPPRNMFHEGAPLPLSLEPRRISRKSIRKSPQAAQIQGTLPI